MLHAGMFVATVSLKAPDFVGWCTAKHEHKGSSNAALATRGSPPCVTCASNACQSKILAVGEWNSESGFLHFISPQSGTWLGM